MRHELKCATSVYDDVERGIKTFEFRKEDDRRFDVGDELHLREYCRKTGEYSGWAVTVLVTYVLRGPDFGIPEGYCIMSIKRSP